MLTVSKIERFEGRVKLVGSVMDAHEIAWQQIGNVNWEEAYPYAPDVKFRIAHTGDAILVEYQVEEEYVRAVADDGGNVWEDSCCEMFLALPDSDTYYNFECNCAGKLLIETGKGRGERERASQAVLNQVERWSSNGNELFAEKPSKGVWKMSLVIPVSSFFRHQVNDLSGMRLRGNFYKCGDKLPKPHFLSWQRIQTEHPDFHRPEYFGEISFE